MMLAIVVGVIVFVLAVQYAVSWMHRHSLLRRSLLPPPQRAAVGIIWKRKTAGRRSRNTRRTTDVSYDTWRAWNA